MSTKKNFKLLTAALLVTVLLLAAIHTFSGPRLVDVRRDGDLSASVITLRFNSPLDKNQSINLKTEPDLPVSISVQSNTLIIRPNSPMKTNASYLLKIEGIKDQRGNTATIHTQIKTPPQSIAFLRRNLSDKDQIFTKKLGQKEKLIYEAAKIGDFALSKDSYIVTVEEQENKEDNLLVVKKGSDTAVIFPPEGEAISVAGSNQSNLFVVRTLQRDTYQGHTYLFNAEDSTFREILNRSGSPLYTADALFGPDGKTILYQVGSDGSIYLDDLSDDRDPLGIGVYDKIVRYLPNGSGVVVRDRMSNVSLLQASGGKVPVLSDSYAYETQLLQNQQQLRLVQPYDQSATRQEIILPDQSKTPISIFVRDALVNTLRLSPSDDYFAVNESQQPVNFDNYKIDPEAVDNQIKIRSIEGNDIETIYGSHLLWL